MSSFGQSSDRVYVPRPLSEVKVTSTSQCNFSRDVHPTLCTTTVGTFVKVWYPSGVTRSVVGVSPCKDSETGLV